MDEGSPPKIEIFRSIVMKITKLQLKEIIREELLKLEESKLNEFSAINWSSPEAKTQVNNDLRSMSKLLGKASQNVIKIMLSGVKDNKYDAMDLSKGIQGGDVRVTHMGERDFLESLWTKIREKFRKYTKSGKLR